MTNKRIGIFMGFLGASIFSWWITAAHSEGSMKPTVLSTDSDPIADCQLGGEGCSGGIILTPD
ncbi:MAG: hypothetical protein JWQ35_195 [Bacteriovoracaceae bacterium]|nr:hypothetical protein [Bacteriovoracaceae bacterium]